MTSKHDTTRNIHATALCSYCGAVRIDDMTNIVCPKCWAKVRGEASGQVSVAKIGDRVVVIPKPTK